jgi:hypothetical protein
MTACPYIEFGQLWPATGSEESDKPAKKQGNLVKALVHWRPTTASALGLSEAQLVELSILCGNDFTVSFPMSLFRDGPPKAVQELSESGRASQLISAAIAWLLSKPLLYRLSSTHPELSLAIRYSRLYYNGLDTKRLVSELEEYRLSNSVVYPRPSMLVSLSGAAKERFKAWLQAHASPGNTTSTSTLGLPAGSTVASYMEHLVDSADGAIELNDGVICLKPHHAVVIRDMLATLSRNGSSSSSFSPRPTLPQGYVPQWSHVLLATAYQNLIRQFKNIDSSVANFEACYGFVMSVTLAFLIRVYYSDFLFRLHEYI